MSVQLILSPLLASSSSPQTLAHLCYRLTVSEAYKVYREALRKAKAERGKELAEARMKLQQLSLL